MYVKAERDGAVATLWLDRTERGHALGAEIADALAWTCVRRAGRAPRR